MRLLVVEDDSGIVASLRRGLRTNYVVDIAKTGADGLDRAEITTYDAIVLDLNLPDQSGLEVCRELRIRPKSAPILILTGSADIEDKVTLLDAGADDYLTKPFSMEELKARLRVLVRRSSRAGSSLLVVDDLKLNTATRHVERAGTQIQLRRKEFDLLEYMMYHSGTVITRSMIIDHVWDSHDNLWTNAVDVHVKYLRDKVDRPFATALIKTVHGVGYKLEVSKPVAAKR